MRSSSRDRFKEKPKPKDLRKTVKRLWGYFIEEKRLLLIVLGLVVIDSIATIVAPFLIGKIIDGIEIKNINLVKILIILLVTSYLIESLGKFIQNFIVFGMSQRVVKKIRSTLFDKLQNLPVSYYDKNSKGDIMSRVVNDVENISNGISDSIIGILSGVITIVATFVVMTYLSPILTLCTIISVPLVMLLTKGIAYKTKELFRVQQNTLGKLNGHIEEMIGQITLVKAFNYEEKSIDNFEYINKELLLVSKKAQIYSSLLMPMMNVINNISFTLISIVGALLVTKGSLTLGIVATFLGYSKTFTRPLNNLANLFNNFQSAVAGCERVFEVLDKEDEKLFNKKPLEFNKIKNDIKFNNISFSYKQGEEVLKDINLNIKANTSNAIIGKTGCGKTTIVNLLTRFYDLDEGSIEIDNVDIRDYSRDSYRNAFGVVLQDSYLFNESIKENIKYGKLDATEDEIISACKKVGAHKFITKLKEGYDTVINEKGQELSQGQRQLLTIARTILKNPNILILDEATSCIDTKTELKIQETMRELMKGKTTFIIAHRLSTIRDCDNIIVIENGQIKEMGNHEELMKLKGYYYHNVNIINSNTN